MNNHEKLSLLQDAILKLGPLPRLLNDISVALRNPQLHMPTNHQPDRPKDRLFSRPSFNRLMSSDFQSLMMRDLNRYLAVSFVLSCTHSRNRMCTSSKSLSRQVMLMLFLLNFIKTRWIIIIANVHLLHIDGGITLSYGVIKSNTSKGQGYTIMEDSVAQNKRLVCF